MIAPWRWESAREDRDKYCRIRFIMTTLDINFESLLPEKIGKVNEEAQGDWTKDPLALIAKCNLKVPVFSAEAISNGAVEILGSVTVVCFSDRVWQETKSPNSIVRSPFVLGQCHPSLSCSQCPFFDIPCYTHAVRNSRQISKLPFFVFMMMIWRRSLCKIFWAGS